MDRFLVVVGRPGREPLSIDERRPVDGGRPGVIDLSIINSELTWRQASEETL